MDVTTTPPHTQALLLLCGHFGGAADRSERPLSLNEYNGLAEWLHRNGMRPEDLLTPDGEREVAGSDTVKGAAIRIPALLRRGMALGFATDGWAREGIWVLGRGSEGYPNVLRKRLGRNAPVLLYGVGPPTLLNTSAIGAVGSRDADPVSLTFARRLGERCAYDGWTLVSGAAKGVDREAMLASIDAGGTAIGVLAEGISKPSRTSLFRGLIVEERLTLVSTVAPGAKWQVGQAMARNKYIYGLSRATVVVSSGTDGGTWSGAVENLQQRWVPLWVREAGDIPTGNVELLARGGQSIQMADLDDPDLLDRLASVTGGTAPGGVPGLEEAAPIAGRGDGDRKPLLTLFDPAPAEPALVAGPAPSSEVGEVEAAPPPPVVPAPEDMTDAFAAVWPLMQRVLSEPKTEAEVAGQLDVVAAQARVWLNRAVDQGTVLKRARPVRYELTPK